MLSRYDGKKVRVTTQDGKSLTGRAESFPSGYGLHVFNREEESLRVRGVHVFLSQIAAIEDLTADAPPEGERTARYDALIEARLDGPWWVADVLPEQVPRDAPGQYFAVDRYYRQPERQAALHRKHAEILLRLNCYDEMAVSFDGGEHWETDPEPEAFADALERLDRGAFLRALFPARGTMIDVEPGDTWMSVYCPDEAMLERIRALAAAEGLFLWQPPEAAER